MTGTKDGIRIDDLRHPVLTDAARQALERAERNPVELTEKAILSSARRVTGLDDYGTDDFRQRLQALLSQTIDDPNLTELGRSLVFQFCVKSVCTRLRMRQLLRRHPEIHDVHIAQPIIIVGPWRSGTTHLHGLLASDSRLRALYYWESADPIPTLQDTTVTDGEPTGSPRDVQSTDSPDVSPHLMVNLLPHLAAMHPLEPNDVAEEAALQAPDFPLGMLDTGSEAQTPHYEYMKTMLKALQWQRGPERWVLKSPQYCGQLGPLLSTFPDATVVMTHRDPVAVVQSLATRMAYSDRLRYREVDTDMILARYAELVENMLRASVRDRHLIPDGQLIDVVFHDFMSEQIGTVERIYAAAGLELTREQRIRMEAFMADHSRYKNGRIVYDLRSDFDTEPAELRKRFSFYCKRFTVNLEVQ